MMEAKQELLLKNLDDATAEAIYLVLYEPMRAFLLENPKTNWDGISCEKILKNINVKQKPAKPVMQEACSLFYGNEKALKAFFESLPDHDKELIEKACWSEYLTYKDLNFIFGKPVVRVEAALNRYNANSFTLFIDKMLNKWSPFFRYSKPWYARSEEEYMENSHFILSFPKVIRDIFSVVLPKPTGYYLEADKSPGNFSIFNVEQNIFGELPLITAYYLQGNIHYTQKGYPNAASARKMSRTLKLKSFPAEGDSGLRALIIAGLFSDNFKIDSTYGSPIVVLQKLFKRDFNHHAVAPYLLSHLKGINLFLNIDFRRNITNVILDIFRNLPSGWITFENLKLYAITHFVELQPLYSSHEFFQLRVKNYVGREISIDNSNWQQYVAFPFLAGHIYLLAAFGLMELSIDADAAPVFTYYDGLRAFRLTELGAYLLGLKNEYTLPEISNENKLLFDENSTMVRIEGNTVLADTMLANYMVKVSENRYQLSPGNFLKDCKTTTDLKNKIDLFRKTVGQKIPVFWENYLTQLVHNCSVLKKKKNIQVYELPPENKELHRLIAQDPVLRSIIIKAEKFHLIIEESNSSLFVKRMKELGYLI